MKFQRQGNIGSGGAEYVCIAATRKLKPVPTGGYSRRFRRQRFRRQFVAENGVWTGLYGPTAHRLV